MIVTNLQARCIEAAGVDRAIYQHFWAKWIDSVNRENKTGFCFHGDFFGDGDVEIDITRPRLALVAASTGLDAYPFRGGRGTYRYIYEYHGVFMVSPAGAIEPTGLVATPGAGWALSIRDQVAMLLDRINQVYGANTPLQVAADYLIDRMLAVRLDMAAPWNSTDCEMIQIVFNALEGARKYADTTSPLPS